jgi:Mrp family chromosome partitioning ATPase
MVAGALPGDGKSFTSLNLAISMAKEADLSVLLVDADVAKQHLSTLFSINNEPGLLDALREPSGNLEGLVLPTDVPSLSVLSAGRRSDNATELLSSNRMEEVSRQLAASDPHRIIIFDSTPLMLTTESQAVAHAVGQIVMVVRAGVTPQSVVLDAVTSLGDRPISFILNQSVARTATDYYYGYEDGREGRAT